MVSSGMSRDDLSSDWLDESQSRALWLISLVWVCDIGEACYCYVLETRVSLIIWVYGHIIITIMITGIWRHTAPPTAHLNVF